MVKYNTLKSFSKSAQVKFGETIGVIFIVYLVIVVGFIWYNNSNSKAITEMIEKQDKQGAFERYDYILKLNLIHKSELGYIDKEFDKTSLDAMANYSQSVTGKEFFRRKLGTSLVTFSLYDIDMNSLYNITVYNNTPVDQRFKQTSYRTLVPVYDGIKKTSYIGVLEILDFNVVN
ncbi:MAG: hypothetical protein HRU03_05310 [Nanoarchaeales archaeon]|nr:hypothetical protein [Nanoarchaeales archaeon]